MATLGLHRKFRVTGGLVLIVVPGLYLLTHAYAERLLALRPPTAPAVAVPAPSATTDVLTTTVPLHRGDALSATNLGHLRLVGAAPAGALTDPKAAAALIATSDMAAGQILLRDSVSAEPGDAGLAALIPDGQRAIALRVTEETAVGDFIRPGDKADLIIVYGDGLTPGGAAPAPAATKDADARIILQNVAVLTVGAALSAAAPPPTGQPRKTVEIRDVTLAVTPEQAVQLSLIRSIATYTLALRNNRDGAPATETVLSAAALLGTGPRQPARAAAPRRRTIETLIGPKVQRVEVQP